MRNRSGNPIDKHVGAQVRMRRLTLGLSQTNLADGVGVTFQQVQKYENGANRISASRLQQIANVLQVEPSFFFDGAPGQTAKADWKARTYAIELLASKDGLALAKAYTAIKDVKLRRRVVKFAERSLKRERPRATATP